MLPNLRVLANCSLAITVLVPFDAVHAMSKERVLYAFMGGNDGSQPYVGLIADSAGNFYGTTKAGGVNGLGTVFELTPDGTETVLHSFAGGSDGSSPVAGVVMDKNGTLYGTTAEGGGKGECAAGCGTVFKIAADGSETILYPFSGSSDGGMPGAGLIADEAGNLFGTTASGGANQWGIVFEIASNGTETVLHSFAGANDGGIPNGLLADKAGNLYGTTLVGGQGAGCEEGCGTVFELAPDGSNFSVLYSFTGTNGDGAHPQAGLIANKSGNFFGTTTEGGESGGDGGCGTIFKVAPDGRETVLYAFAGGSDGCYPAASLIADKRNKLLGTTYLGGNGGCAGGSGCGTVFEFAPNGAEKVLYRFKGGSDGAGSYSGLTVDKRGDVIGTTVAGGGNGCSGGGCGTIFRLKKQN